MTPLSPRRRSELRAEAHKLSPVVIIGDKGLTDEVLTEIDRSLKAHELIKVRATTDERDARAAWIEAICEKLEAHPVQQIGKVFVIYREKREAKDTQDGEGKNQADGADGNESRRRARTDVVSERGKVRQRSRDLDKRREADAKDMLRKGKIKPEVDGTRQTALEKPAPRGFGRSSTVGREPDSSSTRTSRPRSRTPSPRPASGPRRRPRNTSR
jgi:putative YhbY family RNA-binding protein